MDVKEYELGKIDIAWCPGCGNFGIRTAMMQTLAEMDIDPTNLVVVSGIGQAAKSPHYFKCNTFNGLHGRALPPAVAIKAVNPELVVIVESGDGDMYGEGGNHFINNIRRNPDITVIVHNNMVYGLTKGQASPTSLKGFKTPVQVNGVIEEPFNPISTAISMGATFVARTFIGEAKKTKQILRAAIEHRGFSLVDIFQPCVVFNKLNTYQWFRENTYFLEDDYDPHDRDSAFHRSMETGKYPLGIFYVSEGQSTFEDNLDAYKDNKTPIIHRKANLDRLHKFVNRQEAEPVWRGR